MNEVSTMKDLPTNEKPYEKCLEYGTQALSEAELLAVILRTGAKGISAVSLSKKVLNGSPSTPGLLGLYQLSPADLMKIKGIGKVKAIQIKCILELSKRISKKRVEDSLDFNSPVQIASYYMEDLRHCDQEELHVMMLNTKNRLLGEQIISKGTVNASLISPREIFLQSLHYHAVSIIIIHNHPSGDPTPSQEDILLTERIKQAGEMLGIELLDHIIIGDIKYFSFRENKVLFIE